MIDSLVILNNLHELLVHLSLLFVLLRRDFLDVLVLPTRQLLFAEILCSALLPNLVQLFLFFRNVLLRVEQARSGQDLIDPLDVSPSAIFCVELRLHVDERVRIQVHLGKITVVAQPHSRVLQVVVGEKAGEDVLAQKFSQLKDELVLEHL